MAMKGFAALLWLAPRPEWARFWAEGLEARLVSAAEPVNVSLFGESGCPDAIGFIFGPLAAAEKALELDFAGVSVQAHGVKGIMRLDWTPFGNAYFITKECGGVPAPEGALEPLKEGLHHVWLGCGTSSSCRYSSTVRNCYFKRCGLGGDPVADCYGPGALHCQHGSVECFGNRIEAARRAVEWHVPRRVRR